MDKPIKPTKPGKVTGYNIERPVSKPVENLDEKPIGGGGGMKFDQFSEEQMYGPSGKSNYDELAIGAKSKFAISEYPDGYNIIAFKEQWFL